MLERADEELLAREELVTRSRDAQVPRACDVLRTAERPVWLGILLAVGVRCEFDTIQRIGNTADPTRIAQELGKQLKTARRRLDPQGAGAAKDEEDWELLQAAALDAHEESLRAQEQRAQERLQRAEERLNALDLELAQRISENQET